MDIKEIKKICRSFKIEAIALIFSILYSVFSILIAIVTEKIVNNIDNIDYKYFLILIGLIVFSVLFVGIGHYYINKCDTIAEKKLHLYLFNKLIDKQECFFAENQDGKLMNLLNNVTRRISSTLTVHKFILIQASLTVIISFAVLFYYSWIMALATAALIIIIMLLSQKLAGNIGELGADSDLKKGYVENGMLEIIHNISMIKSLNKQSFFKIKYYDNYEKNKIKPDLKYYFVETIYTCLAYILMYALPLIAICVGIAFKNYKAITAGIIFAVYQIINGIQEPVRNIMTTIGTLKRVKSTIPLLDPILTSNLNDNRKMVEDIEFNNISFKSAGFKTAESNMILKDVSFEINKGDFVSIKGDSGSGKSTIFKFINGSLVDDNVDVKINDLSPKEYNFYTMIKIVTQNNYILNDTVINNISLGDNYDNDYLDEIIKICQLEEFVKKYGYDKIIDSTSSNISGGEKARINIARILIRKPEVLLLDEICAALDKHTSEKLAKNIYDFAKKNNITVISISHKDEFEKYSNKIINV